MQTGLIAALAALLAGCASVRAVNPDSGIVEGAIGRTAHAAAFNDLFGTLMFDCVSR